MQEQITVLKQDHPLLSSHLEKENSARGNLNTVDGETGTINQTNRKNPPGYRLKQRYGDTARSWNSSTSLTGYDQKLRHSSASPMRTLQKHSSMPNENLQASSLTASKVEDLDLEISKLKNDYNKRQGLVERHSMLVESVYGAQGHIMRSSHDKLSTGNKEDMTFRASALQMGDDTDDVLMESKRITETMKGSKPQSPRDL